MFGQVLGQEMARMDINSDKEVNADFISNVLSAKCRDFGYSTGQSFRVEFKWSVIVCRRVRPNN